MSPRSEKTEFAKALARRLGISHDAAAQALDGVFSLLADRLREDGRVAIRGVGHFEVVEMKVSEQWQAPRTGLVTQRRSPKSIRFRPSQTFRDRID